MRTVASGEHIPVLLDEVMVALITSPDGFYVDCTFGRGGHTRELLDRLGPNGRVLGLDQDPSTHETAGLLESEDQRFEFESVTFERLSEVVRRRGLYGKVTGVLFDLGVSSPQLDRPERGFSFRTDGPLDMRMDPRVGEPASRFVNTADETELTRVLKVYGEERHAKRIARAIGVARQERPIETTGRLAELVSAAVPRPPPGRRESRIHPATKTFQALRILVNRELDAFTNALAELPDMLAPLGRLVVISFHSLEDRIAKRFIRDRAKKPNDPFTELGTRLRPLGRHQRPSEAEAERNPRARSAVLRAAERVA
ncbi:MAG: 16S rRNA (cytosine(1402)-N(4))-methyltransferase RsmH [Gammaproteobacteria bacterium]|nr:16S rRNA (cytosine(1402)-N(4))-methyltransferase RsmH [Gammaproteobacteria bacterium]